MNDTSDSGEVWDDSPGIMNAILSVVTIASCNQEPGSRASDCVDEWDESPAIVEAIMSVKSTASSCPQDSDGCEDWDDSPAILEAILAVRESPDAPKKYPVATPASTVERMDWKDAETQLELLTSDEEWDDSPGLILALQQVSISGSGSKISADPSVTLALSPAVITAVRGLLFDVTQKSRDLTFDTDDLFLLLDNIRMPDNTRLSSICLAALRTQSLAHSSKHSDVDVFKALSLPPSFAEKFVHRDITGDGNCFYRSVARILFGVEEGHEIVRFGCLWSLGVWDVGAKAAVRKLIGRHVAVNELIASIASLGHWSSDLSPLLVSGACKRRVVTVFPFSKKDASKFQAMSFVTIARAASSGELDMSAAAFLAFDEDREAQPLYLHFDRKGHYRALLKRFHNGRDFWVKPYCFRL